MKYGRIPIVGESSGIGKVAADYLNDKCKELITLSLRKSDFGKWIQTDITNPKDIENLAKTLDKQPIDGLLYFGGSWETDAFTAKYSFEKYSDKDLQNVLDVNLLGPMRIIQALLPNLRLSKNQRLSLQVLPLQG